MLTLTMVDFVIPEVLSTVLLYSSIYR